MKRALPFLLLALPLLTGAWPAFALPTQKPLIEDNTLRLGFEGSSYINSSPDPSKERNKNITGSLQWRGVGDKDQFRSAIEADFLYGFVKPDFQYIDVEEAYLGLDYEKVGIYVGRKRFHWNALDEFWTLGIFQPRFRFDYLNERESGLTGAFIDILPKENFSLLLFASPLFIPERGAPFDISNGECHSSSPWFVCPGSTVTVLSKDTPVEYKLGIPPARELVAHAGGGASLRIGKESDLYFRLSMAYKPMNQLYLAFADQPLDLSTVTVPAIIYPRVIYHRVLGADLGYTMENKMSLTGSVVKENPIRDNTPSAWTTQEPYDATLAGAIFKAPLSAPSRTSLQFGYLHREGGNGDERGPFSTGGKPNFEQRYGFKDAYSIEAKTSFLAAWAQSFSYSIKFVLDTKYTGNLLSNDAWFTIAKQSLLNIGVDIIGSNDKTRADFLSRYQRNDQIHAGVTYVF